MRELLATLNQSKDNRAKPNASLLVRLQEQIFPPNILQQSKKLSIN
jgi:hypothetical protein